ncbi:MAG TPA: hypothetical protein DCR93_25930 [Cytophagales bacterium]|nr:hypothetical protein [Cytophagales bacterium]HAP62789.1 hypothetical protein [Cytophagales bacterium]
MALEQEELLLKLEALQALIEQLRKHLLQLPDNESLNFWIGEVTGLLKHMEMSDIPGFRTGKPDQALRTLSPMQPMQSLEIRFSEIEQGFYSLYPNKAFENRTKELFKGIGMLNGELIGLYIQMRSERG